MTAEPPTPTKEHVMTDHTIASHEEWVAARRRLLAKEKEFLRLRDQLSSERRELPWERVTKRSTDPTVARLSRICSADAASSSFIISCLLPSGRPDVRGARSGPTASMMSFP